MTTNGLDTAPASASNAACVNMLRAMLTEAEKGQVGFAACVLGWLPNNCRVGIEGIQSLEHLGEAGLKTLLDGVERSKENRTPLPRNPELDASYACFNMPDMAVSYDFLTWLIDREMARVRAGAPAPLKVHIWHGRNGDWPALKIVGGYKQMYDNVMRAAIPLIDAAEDPVAELGPVGELATSFDIVAAARAGESVPRFKSSLKAKFETMKWLAQHDLRAGHYITITLRESQTWPHRNSQIENWVKFAAQVFRDGGQVVFVRDTARVLAKPVSALPECPMASTVLDRRLALYEGAKCNLLVANGPVDLLLYTRCPWLCFTDIQPDGHPYVSDTPGFWKARKGIEVGEQFPWSAKDQRIVWAKDDYRNIVKAWEEFDGPNTGA